MNFYRLDNEDKLNCLNRAFLDAEGGWLSLSLDRLEFLHRKFKNDPQVQYAEGLIRKDFIGQGVKAQECFLRAQQQAPGRARNNENYLFSSFNSAKYARNQDEYQRQEMIARALAPDDPDLQLFNSINQALTNGISYAEVLAGAAVEYQTHGKHSELAAFAELALQAGEHSLDNELALRQGRVLALRELDKAAEASRAIRGEGFPPEERLALQEALREIELALALDSENHILWNFKSAWLLLVNQYDEAIRCADRALAACPIGYVKPLTNKALALQKLGHSSEAREVVNLCLRKAQDLGPEGRSDVELAQRILASLDMPISHDDQILGAVAERISTSVQLTSRRDLSRPNSNDGFREVMKGMLRRVAEAGPAWGPRYPCFIAELLTYFSAETARVAMINIQGQHPEEYQHCLYACMQLAVQAEKPICREACRLLLFHILATGSPQAIRASYRQLVLGPTAIGQDEFSQLGRVMREELWRLNPLLIKPMVDQYPLDDEEVRIAREITIARFVEGISRDPMHPRGKGIFWRMLGRFFRKQ